MFIREFQLAEALCGPGKRKQTSSLCGRFKKRRLSPRQASTASIENNNIPIHVSRRNSNEPSLVSSRVGCQVPIPCEDTISSPSFFGPTPSLSGSDREPSFCFNLPGSHDAALPPGGSSSLVSSLHQSGNPKPRFCLDNSDTTIPPGSSSSLDLNLYRSEPRFCLDISDTALPPGNGSSLDISLYQSDNNSEPRFCLDLPYNFETALLPLDNRSSLDSMLCQSGSEPGANYYYNTALADC